MLARTSNKCHWQDQRRQVKHGVILYRTSSLAASRSRGEYSKSKWLQNAHEHHTSFKPERTALTARNTTRSNSGYISDGIAEGKRRKEVKVKSCRTECCVEGCTNAHDNDEPSQNSLTEGPKVHQDPHCEAAFCDQRLITRKLKTSGWDGCTKERIIATREQPQGSAL